MKKTLLFAALAATTLLTTPASAHLLPPVVCAGPAFLFNPHCFPGHVVPPNNPPASPNKPATIGHRTTASPLMKSAMQGTFMCVGSVVAAALHANATQNRELVFKEAASCGVAYWAGGWRLNRAQAGSNVGDVTTCHGAHYKQPGQRYCGA